MAIRDSFTHFSLASHSPQQIRFFKLHNSELRVTAFSSLGFVLAYFIGLTGFSFINKNQNLGHGTRDPIDALQLGKSQVAYVIEAWTRPRIQCRVGMGVFSALDKGNCDTARSGRLGQWDGRSEERRTARIGECEKYIC